MTGRGRRGRNARRQTTKNAPPPWEKPSRSLQRARAHLTEPPRRACAQVPREGQQGNEASFCSWAEGQSVLVRGGVGGAFHEVSEREKVARRQNTHAVHFLVCFFRPRAALRVCSLPKNHASGRPSPPIKSRATTHRRNDDAHGALFHPSPTQRRGPGGGSRSAHACDTAERPRFECTVPLAPQRPQCPLC